MPAARDISGQSFGRLLAVRWASERPSASGGRIWECTCDCGKTTYVPIGSVTSGGTTSCGCAHREMIAALGRRSAKHSMTGSHTYRSWQSMRQRCNDSDSKDFRNYGGRGISVCARWDGFLAFLEDMGERPKGTTLDRIDVNGNYEPSNCRWADHRTQSNNKRSNVVVTHDGQSKTVAQWAEIVGLERKTLEYRIRVGWPADRALTTPSITNRKRHGNQVNDHA